MNEVTSGLEVRCWKLEANQTSGLVPHVEPCSFFNYLECPGIRYTAELRFDEPSVLLWNQLLSEVN